MSNFVWSTTNLPGPSSANYAPKPDYSTIRTKMDSGRVRQRSRFTSGWRTINVKWRFTDEEWTLFQGVVFHKLNRGQDFTDMVLPLGGALATYAVRFVADSISESYVDVMHWDVTAQLELALTSPLTESEVDALLTP